HGARRCLNMRSRRGERQNLFSNSGFAEHLLAILDVAVSAHDDVVVAGIMQQRITFIIESYSDVRWSRAQRLEISRRVIVIMKVDHHDESHRKRVLWSEG